MNMFFRRLNEEFDTTYRLSPQSCLLRRRYPGWQLQPDGWRCGCGYGACLRWSTAVGRGRRRCFRFRRKRWASEEMSRMQQQQQPRQQVPSPPACWPALDAARSDRGGCSSANSPPHTPHFRSLHFVAAAANNNRVRSLRAKGFRVPAEKMMMGGRPGRVAAQSTNTRYTVHPA